MDESKKVIVTGIKPTGSLTLGNYLGAIKNLKNLQKKYPNAIFYIFIADLHATTIKIDPKELRNNIYEVASIYLASGLKNDNTHIFIQSDVLEHANLGFLMESTAYIGEMERMIQFKEKKETQESVRTSLLTYPALMAADILLYDCDIVPIGIDQKQHLEITQTIAERFNKLYKKTFKIPKGIYNENALKIKSLQDPTKKMSKSSDNEKSYILILDDDEKIIKKIKSAVTDSDSCIKYDHELKPGISNLLDILAAIKNVNIETLTLSYNNKSYKELKDDVANAIVEELREVKNNYMKIRNSKELLDILKDGAKKAQKIASSVYQRARSNMGLGIYK